MDEARKTYLLTRTLNRFYDFSKSTIYASYKVLTFTMVSINDDGELVASACDPSREVWFLIEWMLIGGRSIGRKILEAPVPVIDNIVRFSIITDGEIWCEAVRVGPKWYRAITEPQIKPPKQVIVQRFIKQTLPLYMGLITT
jgi:hypothetical protein